MRQTEDLIGLKKAILENPFDLSLRLMMADMADDSGEADLADRIRMAKSWDLSASPLHGFVGAEETMAPCRMRCSRKQFLINSRDWFRRLPIVSVHFRDVNPVAYQGNDKVYRWFGNQLRRSLNMVNHHEIPWPIFVKMDDQGGRSPAGPSEAYYESGNLAYGDLNAAAVAFGREMAKLPPLPMESIASDEWPLAGL